MRQSRAAIVIPARFGSTRFAGKPLVDIDGKPMIQRVWEQCAKVPGISRIVVATDDERIAACVAGFGGEAIMTPSDLASGTDRVAFVARDAGADILVNVQGDEPLIPPELITAVLRPMMHARTIEIGTAATVMQNPDDATNPDIVKVVRSQSGRALYFSRAPIPFIRDVSQIPLHDPAMLRHVGLYVFRRESLLRFAALGESPLERIERLEQLRALEHGMYVHVELVAHEPQAVDVPADVERVTAILRRGT